MAVFREEVGLVVRLRPRRPARRWALLADLHLSADSRAACLGSEPAANCSAAIADVVANDCDGLLINGDLAFECGLPGDYRAVQAQLEPAAASSLLAIVPGNHDDRGNLLEAFVAEANALGGADPPIEKLLWDIDAGPVRLIGLDSLMRTDIVGGLVGKVQRIWLDQTLQDSDDKPTILFVHHPFDDEDGGLLDGERLLRVAQAHSQVKAIFTAHAHLFEVRREGGVHVVAQPAVGFVFEPDEAMGWLRADFREDGIDLELRAVAGPEADRVRLDWLR